MYIAVGNLFHIKSWSHDVGKEKGKLTAFMEGSVQLDSNIYLMLTNEP